MDYIRFLIKFTRNNTYIEHASIGAVGSDNWDDLSEDNLIVANADQHPYQVDYVLCSRLCTEISISYSCQDLHSPVDTLEVEQNCVRLNQTFPYYPGIVCKIIQLGGKIPNAREQVDQENTKHSKFDHFRGGCTKV